MAVVLVALAALRLALGLPRLAARPRRPAHALRRVADPGGCRALPGPLRHELSRRVRGAPPAARHARARGSRVPRVRPGHARRRRGRPLGGAALLRARGAARPRRRSSRSTTSRAAHGSPDSASSCSARFLGLGRGGRDRLDRRVGERARTRRLGGAALALGAAVWVKPHADRAGPAPRVLGVAGVPRADARPRARGRRRRAGAARRWRSLAWLGWAGGLGAFVDITLGYLIPLYSRLGRSDLLHELVGAGLRRWPCWRASRPGPASAPSRSRAGGGGADARRPGGGPRPTARRTSGSRGAGGSITSTRSRSSRRRWAAPGSARPRQTGAGVAHGDAGARAGGDGGRAVDEGAAQPRPRVDRGEARHGSVALSAALRPIVAAGGTRAGAGHDRGRDPRAAPPPRPPAQPVPLRLPLPPRREPSVRAAPARRADGRAPGAGPRRPSWSSSAGWPDGRVRAPGGVPRAPALAPRKGTVSRRRAMATGSTSDGRRPDRARPRGDRPGRRGLRRLGDPRVLARALPHPAPALPRRDRPVPAGFGGRARPRLRLRALLALLRPGPAGRSASTASTWTPGASASPGRRGGGSGWRTSSTPWATRGTFRAEPAVRRRLHAGHRPPRRARGRAAPARRAPRRAGARRVPRS